MTEQRVRLVMIRRLADGGVSGPINSAIVFGVRAGR